MKIPQNYTHLLLALIAVVPLVAKKDKDSVLDSINRRVAYIAKKLTETTAVPTYDYVIVGAGTAGATLANKLSANNSVLVVEAGPNLTQDTNVTTGAHPTPPGQAITFNNLWFNQKYAETQFVMDLANFVAPDYGWENYSAGIMWGGSSGHNAMQAFRGTSDIYNNWATISGDSRWSYNNLLPYMKDLESFEIVPSNSFGESNPAAFDPCIKYRAVCLF